MSASTNSDYMTADDLKSALADAVKAGNTELFEKLNNVRTASKMQFREDSVIEVPIGHRKGNLPLFQKQLLNVMRKGADFINDGISESQLADADRRGIAAENRLFNGLRTKAITTSGVGSGLEWMDTQLSSVLLQRMYLASLLAQEFAANEVNMPSNPYEFPLVTTRPVFRLAGEGVAVTPSQPGTGGLTLNAKKLMGEVEYNYEADEDSIIAVLPLITSKLGDAAADALENCLINGDTAGTQDTGTPADSCLKAFDGIRKLALAQAALKVSLATGGISAANILRLKKSLGRWGLDPSKLILVAGTKGYNDLVGLPETLTVEKVGQTARILTGTAPSIFGIDIIPSAAVREDLNASGVFDNAVTTKGSIVLIYKPAWIPGVRRGFTIEQDRNISTQKRNVVASFRRDFKPTEPLDAANAAYAAVGINFDS